MTSSEKKPVRMEYALIRPSCLLLSLLVAGTSADASGIDGFAVEIGESASSDSLLTRARLSLQQDWNRSWSVGRSARITGYWDLSLSHWKNRSRHRTNREVFDIGLTPTLRMEGAESASLSPYAEIGVGLHMLSHSSVSAFRRFGSSFQFSEHFGAGFRFGTRRQFDLGYRFEHISNGGLQPPNKGINYSLVRFGVHL